MTGRATARAIGWLFVATALLYLWTAGSNFATGDAYAELAVTQSLVEHGWVDVQPLHPGISHDGSAVLGVDGRFYASHGLGYSLFLLPFYLAARVTSALSGAPHCTVLRDCLPNHLISWSGCLVAAATAALLCRLCLDLGYSLRRSFALALIYAFASPAWPYARFGFDVMLTSLLILGAVRETLLAVRPTAPAAAGQARRWLRAGGLAALAILVRLPAATAVLPLGIVAVLAQRRASRSRRALHLGAFVAPLALVLAFSGWYNLVRFGSLIDDGHSGNPAEALATTPLIGLAGLLVSTGKGLLWYSPALVLALLAIPTFYRRRPAACLLALGAGGALLLPYPLVRDWYGGWAWGPRFAMTSLPLLLLPAIALPELRLSPRQRLLAGLVIATGVLIQLAGVLVNYHDRLSVLQRRGLLDRIFWDPRYSPIGDHFGTLASYLLHPGDVRAPTSVAQSYDLWWLNLWRNDGLPVAPVLLAGLLTLTLALLACRRCLDVYRRAVSWRDPVVDVTGERI